MADDSEQDKRDAILSEIWSRLDAYEAEHPECPYATVLRLRIANLEARPSELAEMFSRSRGISISAVELRRLLQDARSKFCELFAEHKG
jgi:hypothetical protein